MSSKIEDDNYITYEDLIDDGALWGGPIIIDATLFFFLGLINDILSKMGIRKIALVKKSDKGKYELLVKCPYCKRVYYQKKATRKFKCPHCHKKSPIITTKGELANLCFKRINKPEIDNIPYETTDTPQFIEH